MSGWPLRGLARSAILAGLAFTAPSLSAQAPAPDQTPPPKALEAPGAPSAVPERQSALSAELMYRILVGEVALQRGDYPLAARAYFEAARDTKDSRLARRATEISLAARQRAMALESARLWADLEPTAERPKQVVASLLSSGGVGGSDRNFGTDLKAELERALADAASSNRLSEAFMQLNRMLANEPDKAATLKLVRALAQPYPNLPEAQFAIALAAFAAGLSDEATIATATEAIDRALAQRPGWDQAIVLKAEILARQSADRAADFLVEALQRDPDSKAIQASLAQMRIQQKKYEDAIAIFKALSDKDPGNNEYQFAMAVLSMQMRDWARAEALFKELQEADYGEDGLVEYYLAQIADETGRYALAIERFKEVQSGERGWIAKLRIASMMGKLGQIDEARRYLNSLEADTAEKRIQVLQAEAQLLRDAGDNATAYVVLESALVVHPDEPDLLYDIAMVAEKLGRIEVAEAKLLRLIDLKPSNAQALNALGYTLVDRTPRIDEGLAFIERALVLSPDDPFILDSVGWANFKLGKFDEAEKYLRRALEQRPDPEIAAHLGEVLWAKGDKARAEAVWQSQLKTTPDNALLLETVRRLSR